jgi:hypothetical protein
MVFKLGLEARKTLAPAQLPGTGVIGVKFVDGEEQTDACLQYTTFDIISSHPRSG